MRRAALFVAALLIVPSCEPRGKITLEPAAVSVGTVETVFIGTRRGADPVTGEPFGYGRSMVTRYARLDVSVPPVRRPGQIDWPRAGFPANPQTQFLAVRNVTFEGPAAFRANLAQALSLQPGGRRDAVVFVHGFNNNFAEGVYRLAQLGHDLGLKDTLVHYSWPSRANPLGYAYDRDSALFARDGLSDLFHQVDAAGARSVLVVAHSMGAALTMETLRQMAIARDPFLRARISAIALISPDLDIDVFREQMMTLGRLPAPVIIFTSRKDKALSLAARLTGERARLGNLSDIAQVSDLDVTVIDTSAFSTGSGHFNAARSPALLAILGRLPDLDAAFARDRAGRTGLLPGVALTFQNATEVILSPVSALGGALP
jgi:esterase/lipase superfamily enzyme